MRAIRDGELADWIIVSVVPCSRYEAIFVDEEDDEEEEHGSDEWIWPRPVAMPVHSLAVCRHVYRKAGPDGGEITFEVGHCVHGLDEELQLYPRYAGFVGYVHRGDTHYQQKPILRRVHDYGGERDRGLANDD